MIMDFFFLECGSRESNSLRVSYSAVKLKKKKQELKLWFILNDRNCFIKENQPQMPNSKKEQGLSPWLWTPSWYFRMNSIPSLTRKSEKYVYSNNIYEVFTLENDQGCVLMYPKF